MGLRNAAATLSTLSLLSLLLHGCVDFQSKFNLPLAHLRQLEPPTPSSLRFHDDDDLLYCPAGYISKTPNEGKAQAKDEVDNFVPLSECGLNCDRVIACKAFMFSPSEKRCVPIHQAARTDGLTGDYRFCVKKDHQTTLPEAPLYNPHEYVEQNDSEFLVGQNISLYAVGSSSLLWMTWLDQLHLLLQRLGYNLPVVPSKMSTRLYPLQAPMCDDTQYFEHLQTTRFAKIGWSSWDFAFEGWEDCKDGWRVAEGIKVKCQHGAGCSFGTEPVALSSIAEDASKSNLTLVATWYNDDQQWSSHFKCFDGKKHSSLQIAPLSVSMLLKMIRSIHAENPHTWIVVMGKYPQTFHHITYPFLTAYNLKVKLAVEQEPKTLFVDFYMPNSKEGQFYQIAHSGHPNCRGSRLMAHAVVQRLFDHRVLSRSIKLEPLETHSILNESCSELNSVACHTSALCWVDPVDDGCKPYSAGSRKYHTVCKDSICGSEAAEELA